MAMRSLRVAFNTFASFELTGFNPLILTEVVDESKIRHFAAIRSFWGYMLGARS